MSKRIEQLLSKAGLAINNSLQNTELAPILAEYGYSPEKLKAGKALLDELSTLEHKQSKEYGDQYQATHELEEKKETAHKVYMRFVKIARVALADENAAWESLGLRGDRKQSTPGWLAQCFRFYSNLNGNSHWKELMGNFGVSPEKLVAGEALVSQVEQAFNKQKTEMGEAQEATRLRDQAADKLQAWYSDFIAIARIALEDQPQYLEILGVVER